MNRAQKIARFNLIVILTALILSVTAIGVTYFFVGLPIHRAFGGFGFMGITGLMGLSPLLYKKGRDKVLTSQEWEHCLQIASNHNIKSYTSLP